MPAGDASHRRQNSRAASRLRAGRSLLRQFAGFAGPARLARVTGLILAGAAVEGLGILLLVPLIEYAQRGADAPASGLAAWLPGGTGQPVQLAGLLLAAAAFFALRAGVLIARETNLSRLQHGFVRHLKLRLLHLLAEAPWHRSMRLDRAHLVKVLGSDMVQIALTVNFALQAAVSLLVLAAYGAFAFVLSPTLSLLALACLCAAWLVGLSLIGRFGRLGGALAASDLLLARESAHFLADLKLAKAQGLEDRFVAHYDRASRSAVAQRVELVRVAATSRHLALLLGALAAVAAVIAANLITAIGTATLIAFVVLLSRAMGPVAVVQQGMQYLAQSLPLFGQLSALESQLGGGPAAMRADRPPVSSDAGRSPPLLAISGVVASPGEGDGVPREALRIDRLEIRPGEFLGLYGVSGSGKTTLLDLVALVTLPDRGQVTVDGEVATGHRLRAYRERLAYLDADATLFAGTLRENLAWFAPDAGEAEMHAALALADAGALVRRFTAGLDGKVEERGANFSAGERQQIALARCLLRRPLVLLLDEATASLDLARERRVLGNLALLNPRPTMVMISHRLQSLDLCDRVLTLADGRIVDAAHRQLAAVPIPDERRGASGGRP